MWLPELWIAMTIFIALTIYVLSGGADFGGGVWDFFARGPRAEKQRQLIAEAIAPIWEANHVWLILAIVLLFVCFPLAFATICTALHIPLTLMLIGIVLRGSAFTFRSYGLKTDKFQKRWSRVFDWASILTPITLGITVGAIASGNIRVDTKTGVVLTDFFSSWLAPFPFAVGFFTLGLFAFLAAVYLISETDDPELKEDFRNRALITSLIVGVIAFICFLLAKNGAPLIWQGLYEKSWSIPFHFLTGIMAVGAIVSLWKRRYHLARGFAVIQTGLIILGWSFSQYPYIVVPDLTFLETAAPVSVLKPVLVTLGLGAVLLIPSFWYLYSIFKGRKPGDDLSME